ncbi:MAG TPA: lipid II flippase MurJ [Vicinamibacterales bacterium]|nr:lipid II flippase MurJ [Vicinamibacterales bacterium]
MSVATLVAGAVGATTQQAAIPFLMEARRQRRDIGAYIAEMSSSLLLLAVIPTLLLSGGVFFYLSRHSHWSAGQLGILTRMLWLLVPYIAFSVLSGIYAGTLNAEHRYNRVAISPAIRSGIVLVVAVTMSVAGVTGLAIGYVVGELARVVFLIVQAAKRQGVRLLAWPGSDGIGEFFRTAVWQMLGSGVVAFIPLLDRIMASSIGPGSVSVLDYADKLWQVPVGFALSGIMVTSLGHWSERFQQGGTTAILSRDTSRLAAGLFAAVMPLSILFVLIRASVVPIVFRAAKLSPGEIGLITDTLAAMTLGIPSYIAGLIYTRAFLVLKRSDLLLLIGAIELCMKPALNALLIPGFGTVGIGVATVITYSVAALLFVVIFHAWLARPSDASGRDPVKAMPVQ